MTSSADVWLALDEKLRNADSEPWCGVQIIDLDKNCCVDWLRIDGKRNPEAIDTRRAIPSRTACDIGCGRRAWFR